jgi:hypothetical protein
MRFTCGITNSALSPFATVGLTVVRDGRTGSATSSSKTLDVPSSSDSSSSELEDDSDDDEDEEVKPVSYLVMRMLRLPVISTIQCASTFSIYQCK